MVESGFGCVNSPSECTYTENAAVVVVSQQMESEAVVCNTITFGVQIHPQSGIFGQSFMSYDSFVSTPNGSVMTLNRSMLNYTSDTLYLSFFLLADLQNTTLIF